MRPILTLSLLMAMVCALQACGPDPSTGDAGGQPATLQSGRSPSPPGATVFIVEPANRSTVSSPVAVKFGISGMEVSPAGTLQANAGHHHLIVDAELPDLTLPVPSSANYVHFGKGQTETVVELPPGQHTLQLILGDALHVPHDPPVVSKVIVITVE